MAMVLVGLKPRVGMCMTSKAVASDIQSVSAGSVLYPHPVSITSIESCCMHIYYRQFIDLLQCALSRHHLYSCTLAAVSQSVGAGQHRDRSSASVIF